jgi:hypothetical protein
MENLNMFKEKGYCVVKSSIDSDLRDFITQYTLFDEMRNFEADTQQVVGAHAKYADPVMETLLIKLLPLMEKHTGLELDPTYSFYRVYRPGHELTVHRDRPSCEISCTLCFNYSYENTDYSWPIYMDGNKVDQTPGDLAIYRGCDLEHWREKFNIDDDQAWHVQGFFHYVDKNGPYADYKFDCRENLGLPKYTAPAKKHYIEFVK